VSCEGWSSCSYSDWWHNGDVGCRSRDACIYMDYESSSDPDDHMVADCTGDSACWMTFEKWFHTTSTAALMNAGQSFNCRAMSACQSAQMPSVNTCSATDSCKWSHIGYKQGDLRCGGAWSCKYAEINRIDGDLVCAGTESCGDLDAIKESNALYCDGKLACGELTVVNGVPSKVFLRGQAGLSNAHLQSKDVNGNAVESFELYAYAADAVKGTTVMCQSGSTCTLYCFGNACDGMERFECSSAAVCSCEGDSCPEVAVVSTSSAARVLPAGLIKARSQRVEAMAVHTELSETQAMNEPLAMLLGAGAVMMVLGAAFYLYDRKGKDTYQQL